MQPALIVELRQNTMVDRSNIIQVKTDKNIILKANFRQTLIGKQLKELGF